MFHLIPAPLHRMGLRLAHGMRHRWRGWSGRPIAGVSVVVTDLADGVLLLKHSYGSDVWALPGGGMKRGEDAEACARRELKEELGIDAVHLTEIGQIEEDISGAPHTAWLFTTRTDQRPRPDGREVIEARFFPAHSLPEPLGRLARARLALWQASQKA